MAETQGVPRRLTPTIVTVDAGPGTRMRFHSLLVCAYREWESGTRGPTWLRCSAHRPGVASSDQ